MIMERPERMPIGTLGLGRRLTPHSPSTSNGITLPPPIPSLRKVPSSSTLSASTAMSSTQVIALAREAMQDALHSESQAAGANGVGGGLKTGVTVDLSRKQISKLPDEFVDIVKHEVERLAISHNQLTTIPSRFTECTSLRYLNIRGNQIKEFPMALCDLKSLEILDLGRNQLRALPPEIAKLTSLKVLSVPKNQIRELPMCLAEMGSLQVIKFEGNPISFPPRDALQPSASSPPNEGTARDNEVTDVSITSNIKKYLKYHAANGRSETDTVGDESSEAGEPQRVPLKRAASGRFPIKVSGNDLSEMRSPNMGRPPPVPSRSHQRGLSQQSTTIRRPTVLPLTIGSGNERVRSNSESILRAERSESRQRRMGVVSKKTSELGTLDETEANNRFSHYRGLSHGSAMTGTPANPANAVVQDQTPNRPVYVRRLSVLPERRRESRIFDPIVEAAKGVLYSVFQIHPMIQALMSLTNDGSPKRSSLEIVVYNTNVHVQELEQEIQKHESAGSDDEDPGPMENENVQRACQTLVDAYGHVCSSLAGNIDTFVDNGDARYIRTLIMMIYHSIMELRITLSTVTGVRRSSRLSADSQFEGGNTIKPYHQRELSAPAPSTRPPIMRSRNGTMIHNPVKTRAAPDLPSLNVNNMPSAMPTSATPRSGESFASLSSRGPPPTEFSEEDALFERIFFLLQKSVDIVSTTLPDFHVQLAGGLKDALQQRAPRTLLNEWKALISMCASCIQQTETLKYRLSILTLNEPGIRSQPSFWNMCSNFVASWADMAQAIKIANNSMPLPPDTRTRLRPIQQNIKECSSAVVGSPWHHLFRPSEAGGVTSPFGSQTITNLSVPITPQSAALGPAMQATVPTPQGVSFAAAFQGSVFDRADALIKQEATMTHGHGGRSMSRGRTMTRGHSGFDSLSSISSMGSDGSSTALGPNSAPGPGAHRTNGSKF